MHTGGGTREWAGVVAALAAAVRDGWRAGATALWAAGRRREAVWLRADHRAAAAVLLGAASGRQRDVVSALRHCGAMEGGSAAHPMLAAPWRDAARVLAVAAGLDGGRAAPPLGGAAVGGLGRAAPRDVAAPRGGRGVERATGNVRVVAVGVGADVETGGHGRTRGRAWGRDGALGDRDPSGDA